MKKGFIWFSCHRDSITVIESMKAVIRLDSSSSRLVVSDPQNPIADAQVEVLKGMGASVITRGFSRGGNLQGRGAIIGVLNCMIDEMLSQNLTHIVKVDSDTILSTLDWITEDDQSGFALDEVWEFRYMIGAAYCISLKACIACIDDLMVGKSIEIAGEDAFISTFIQRNGFSFHKTQQTNNEKPAVFYEFSKGSPLSTYTKYKLVTFGQDRPKGMSRCDHIQYEALAMGKLNKELSKIAP